MSEFIHNVPMVALNELTSQCGIPLCLRRRGQAGRIAAEYLISRGCRNLLFSGVQAETSGPQVQGCQRCHGQRHCQGMPGKRNPHTGGFSLIGFDNITEELPYIELTTVAVSHENRWRQPWSCWEWWGGHACLGGGQGFREAGTAAGGTPFL